MFRKLFIGVFAASVISISGAVAPSHDLLAQEEKNIEFSKSNPTKVKERLRVLGECPGLLGKKIRISGIIAGGAKNPECRLINGKEGFSQDIELAGEDGLKIITASYEANEEAYVNTLKVQKTYCAGDALTKSPFAGNDDGRSLEGSS